MPGLTRFDTDLKIPYRKGTISFPSKHITALDGFVLDFTGVLSPHTPYVIVSGYVAILFGRSRGTEDIGILMPRMHEP